MPASKAKIAANARYSAKAYERVSLFVVKGKKETYQAHATEQSESLNGFVNRAMEETMHRDKNPTLATLATTPPPPTTKLKKPLPKPKESLPFSLSQDDMECINEHLSETGEHLHSFVNRAIGDAIQQYGEIEVDAMRRTLNSVRRLRDHLGEPRIKPVRREKTPLENLAKLFDMSDKVLAKLQEHADKRGESLADFVHRALSTTLHNDNDDDFVERDWQLVIVIGAKKKDAILEHAAKTDGSFDYFAKRAIKETMERDVASGRDRQPTFLPSNAPPVQEEYDEDGYAIIPGYGERKK